MFHEESIFDKLIFRSGYFEIFKDNSFYIIYLYIYKVVKSFYNICIKRFNSKLKNIREIKIVVRKKRNA